MYTESWLVPDIVFEFIGYLTFRRDRRSDRAGGVLILIRNEFAVAYLDFPNPVGDIFDAVGLSVCSPLGAMAAVCAYMPRNFAATSTLSLVSGVYSVFFLPSRNVPRW